MAVGILEECELDGAVIDDGGAVVHIEDDAAAREFIDGLGDRNRYIKTDLNGVVGDDARCVLSGRVQTDFEAVQFEHGEMWAGLVEQSESERFGIKAHGLIKVDDEERCVAGVEDWSFGHGETFGGVRSTADGR